MQKFKSILKDIIEVVLTSFILVLILNNFVVMSCVVEGSSMYPRLKDNDYGYSFIITRKLGLDRFDTVVVEIEDSDKLLVKRVIGLPGETVSYKDSKLYINGEHVAEDFLTADVFTNDLEVVLGTDEYFCLGDNRSVSIDSRRYGPFKGSQILSSHLFVIYPFESFGFKK